MHNGRTYTGLICAKQHPNFSPLHITMDHDHDPIRDADEEDAAILSAQAQQGNSFVRINHQIKVELDNSVEKLQPAFARPLTLTSLPSIASSLFYQNGGTSSHANHSLDISTLSTNVQRQQNSHASSSAPTTRPQQLITSSTPSLLTRQELFAIAEDPVDIVYAEHDPDLDLVLEEEEEYDEDEEDLESAFLPSFSLATATLLPPPRPLVQPPPPPQSNTPPQIILSPSPPASHSFTTTTTTTTTTAKRKYNLNLQPSLPPTLSLSFRSISPNALRANYRSLNAQSQLALILSLPWCGMSAKTRLKVAQFGTSAAEQVLTRRSSNNHNAQLRATTNLFVAALGLGIGLSIATISCIGCFCIARLILPQVRCFVVVSRQALAKAVAAGQQLLAVVLVVKEPRPPPRRAPIGQLAARQHAHRLSGSRSNNNNRPARLTLNTKRLSSSTTRQLFLSPKTPVHPLSISSCPSSTVVDDDDQEELSHSFKSSTTTRPASSVYSYGSTINASQYDQDGLSEPVDSTELPSEYFLEHHDPNWTYASSPTSTTSMILQDPNNIPPMPSAFHKRWSTRRQSTLSASTTVVTQASSPRPQRPSPSRDRSKSAVDRASKRLSVSFPVQPSPSARPSSWMPSSILSPEAIESPTEGNFLTVLAYQERRVLELKDELKRAEDHLSKLKRQWATMEYKKAQQQHAQQQMQPQPEAPVDPVKAALSALEGTNTDQSYTGSWLQKELERRKNFSNMSRKSGRKVFSGSRHTRTLSLLSPDKLPTSDQVTQSGQKKKPAGLNIVPPSAVNTPTPVTKTTDLATSPAKDDFYAELTATPKEVIYKTGKQMVGDIKDGFMTFFEDIRQATIGDEAINGQTPQPTVADHADAARVGQKSVLQAKRVHRQSRILTSTQGRIAPAQSSYFDPLLDGVQGAFWREHGLGIGIDMGDENSPAIQVKAKKTKPSTTIEALKSVDQPNDPTPRKCKEFMEDWDTWSTPAKTASSTADASPVPALEHIKSPSASSESTTAHDPNGAESEDVTMTLDILTPLSASFASSDDVVHKAQAAASRSKRDSGIWSSNLNLAKIAPSGVAQLKRTASQFMADWERGVAANSPSGTNQQQQQQ